MAASMLVKVRASLRRFEARILAFIKPPFPPGLAPAVAIDSGNTENVEAYQPSIMESIFGNGILWAAVPKRRRTAESRANRRMSLIGHREEYLPKKNIVACLECGHWHQKHTICGNCYEKVKTETKEMQESMDYDTLHHNVPRSEVHVLYEGEGDEREVHKGKYIVEMKKKRPDWFPRTLMTPVKR